MHNLQCDLLQSRPELRPADHSTLSQLHQCRSFRRHLAAAARDARAYIASSSLSWLLASRDNICTNNAASWACAGILEPSFASYLRNFTEHSAPQPDPAAKLFLLRNFLDGQAADPGAMPPATGVELTNGLECKIATATSKVPCRPS